MSEPVRDLDIGQGGLHVGDGAAVDRGGLPRALVLMQQLVDPEKACGRTATSGLATSSIDPPG